MPIRPENRERYPKNWPEIRERILDRAKNEAGWPCCEWCGVANGDIGYRDVRGDWHSMPPFEKGETVKDSFGNVCNIVEIVLTIAHLDHTPEHCADENLKALCQRCHNRYDAPMRRAGIQARARAQRASGDLFQCSEAS